MIYDTGSFDLWVPNFGCFGRSSEHSFYFGSQWCTQAVKDSTFSFQRGCGPVAASHLRQALREASLRAQSNHQQIRWSDIPALRRP